MATLLEFLPRARALHGLPLDAESLLEDLLGQLLLLEGPPPAPIPDVSDDHRSGIVRSEKGKPLCVAHTWLTGPWRCLLLDTRSIPMGRPIFLREDKDDPNSHMRTILDSPSQTFQRRIKQACLSLDIQDPLEHGAVHAIFGANRTFLAWRPREENETFDTALRYDTDNAAKNILDGLQSAGVLRNDRGVFRLSASKELPEGWEQPPLPLEKAIQNEATRLEAAGHDLDAIRTELRLSKAHMARIFPGRYSAPRTAREKDPLAAKAAAGRAFKLLTHGTPYPVAKRQAHALASVFRPLAAAHLHDRVLKALDSQSPLQIARDLGMDVRTLKGLFRDHPDLAKRLGATARPKGEKKAKGKALERAAQAVLDGNYTPKDAADHYQVNYASLNARLTKMRKKQETAGQGPKPRRGRPPAPGPAKPTPKTRSKKSPAKASRKSPRRA